MQTLYTRGLRNGPTCWRSRQRPALKTRKQARCWDRLRVASNHPPVITVRRERRLHKASQPRLPLDVRNRLERSGCNVQRRRRYFRRRGQAEPTSAFCSRIRTRMPVLVVTPSHGADLWLSTIYANQGRHTSSPSRRNLAAFRQRISRFWSSERKGADVRLTAKSIDSGRTMLSLPNIIRSEKPASTIRRR